MRRTAFGAIVALALLVAACGGGESAFSTTTAAASTTTAVAAASTTPTATSTTAAPTTATTTEPPIPETEYTAWIEAFGEVGECVDVAYNAAGDDADYAVRPQVVDCAAAHDNEVYYRGEYPAEAGAAWPGMDALAEEVFGSICAAPFEERTGGAYDEVPLGYWGYWPLEDAWAAGERTLACAFATLDTTEDVPLFGTVAGPSVTFPGQALAVITEAAEIDVWLYEWAADGSLTDANITRDRSELEEALQAPGWSPDGTVLVYAARAIDEENTDLYALSLETGEKVRLTETDGPEGGPEISPDGSLVLFAAIGEGDEWDLFLLDVGTFEVTRLTDSPDREASAAWSPDGSQIIYRRETSGQSDLWIMNADGSAQRVFRANDADEFDPAWSPDGDSIAYISDRFGDFDVFVAPVDGDGETRLTFDASDDEYPAWSPDGQYLVFNSNRYGYQGLFVMTADGSGVSPLFWDFPAGFAAFAPAR